MMQHFRGLLDKIRVKELIFLAAVSPGQDKAQIQHKLRLTMLLLPLTGI